MAYGILTDEMCRKTQPLVVGREVWDLGAGYHGRALELVELGASRVTAVDKQEYQGGKHPQVLTVTSYFRDLNVPDDGIRVAFVAWPANYPSPGLVPILEQSDVVIYLGSNTNGNACGHPRLFEHLLGRELITHVPHHKNSLLVCGGPLPEGETRPPTPEEYAALSGQMMTFEQACAQGLGRLLAGVPFLAT